MNRITDVVIANKSYASLKFGEDGKMDGIVMQVLKQDSPDFLIPFQYMEIDGEKELRYQLSEGTRLIYFPKKMQKRDFCDLMIHLLSPFFQCSDWFLDYHHFLLDEKYIFIGKNGQSIRYLYIPEESFQISDEQILDFFTSLMFRMDLYDDSGYMLQLLRMTKMPELNLSVLLHEFQKEQEEVHFKKVPTEKKAEPKISVEDESADRQQQVFSAPLEQEKLAPFTFHNAEKEKFSGNHEAEALIQNLFGDAKNEKAKKEKPSKEKNTSKKTTKAGGILGLLKGKKKETDGGEKEGNFERLENKPLTSTEVQNKNGNSRNNQFIENLKGKAESVNTVDAPVVDFSETGDETQIVRFQEMRDGDILRMRLEKNIGCRSEEYIEIHLINGAATVGRVGKNGVPQADFNFDASLSFISRKHFRIEKHGEQWQIIDIGSTNGTSLNGESLAPNMAYPLKPGDVISISCNRQYLAYRVC